MRGTYVAPQRAEYTREQACVAYWQACGALGWSPTVELVSVLVAHGALESGNFKTGLWNNNPGNIKAGEAWEGKYTCVVLNEVLTRNGKNVTVWFAPEGELVAGKSSAVKGTPVAVPPGHPQTRLRAFDTLADGIADKLRFLSMPHWLPALAPARRGDPSGYVRAIRGGGYFTAYKGQPDPTPYETSVVSLFHSYRPIVEATRPGDDHGNDPPAAA